jgi:hypothetical protein
MISPWITLGRRVRKFCKLLILRLLDGNGGGGISCSAVSRRVALGKEVSHTEMRGAITGVARDELKNGW